MGGENKKKWAHQLEPGTGTGRLRPNPSAVAMADEWDDEVFNLSGEEDEDVMASQNSAASAVSQASASSRKFKDKSLIPTDSYISSVNPISQRLLVYAMRAGRPYKPNSAGRRQEVG